ncbi:RipA family octameric membrane protein [Enterobacter asburiae]|uniref:RipA family octameric membrane protein n=1 Tax=Enterobacter TaxID=547 RepID=UPI003C2D48FC
MDLKEKIDIYKLCIDMADKTSERRLKTNAFIIAINTGLISLNSYLSTAGLSQIAWSSIICLVCIIVNLYWMFLVSTYKKINEAKYKTINKIENDNNFPFKPFNEEYNYLKSKRYFHLTSIERLIPLTLIILNVVIISLTFNSETKSTPQTTIINIIPERA